jgi:hypothetical protein
MMGEPGHRDEKALALPLPPPATKVARNLQVASSREFVYVDRKGRVLSPARLRVNQAISYEILADGHRGRPKGFTAPRLATAALRALGASL